MENEKFQINLGAGVTKAEVIVREVSEVNELKIKAPVRIGLIGTIGAPAEFLLRRMDCVNDDSSAQLDARRQHVIVDREKVSIELIINEDDEYNRGSVVGRLEAHPKFKEFGINAEKNWAPNQLGQFLKMNRAFFPDKEKNMMLVTELKNFVAKVNTLIEKQKSDKGDFKDNYSGTVSSNLPDSFSVNIPLFKGVQAELIEVEFYAETSGSEVWLQLVSPGANQLFEEMRDRVIDDEIKNIREIAPTIVIIEK